MGYTRLEQLSDKAKKLIDNKCLDELVDMQTRALEVIGEAQAQLFCGMISSETYEEFERIHLLTFNKCQEAIDMIRDGDKEVTGFELRGVIDD